MVDGVISGFSAFTGLVGMARGMKDMNDSVVRNEAVFAMTEKLLDAQQEYAALAQKVGELEAKLAAYETWEREKERYELKEHGSRGALAYALKEGVQPSEPAHSICPDCYQSRKKSILQNERFATGAAEALICKVCGWDGYTRGFRMPDHSGKPTKRRSAAHRPPP
jgi:hypothetical protein